MIARTIVLQARAPHKPALGAPCNGCGACCALETCPVARIFLRQWRGPCRALLWQDELSRYACAMVVAPGKHLSWLPRWLRPWAGRFLALRIAAGRGCDADLDIES